MKSLYLLLVLLPFMSSDFLLAQPGSPDPEFSGDGVLLESILPEAHGFAGDALVQKDGKILVTGSSNFPADYGFAVLLRYLPDGTPDPDFNGTGRLYINYPDYHCSGSASIQQPDEKIVTVFRLYNPATGNLIALMRFHPDGSPDTLFGTNGVELFDMGMFYQAPQTMGIQPDGKLVIGGYVGEWNAEIDEFFVARFKPNGSLDKSFDDDGYVITTVGETYTNVASILIQPDGRIIAAGYAVFNGIDNFAAVRYTSTGALDPTFHEDGIAAVAFGDAECRGIDAVLQPDGKVVFSGYVTAEDGKDDMAAVRLTTDGVPDSSFHGDGKVKISLSNFGDGAYTIGLQPDGKILLGGHIHSSMNGGSDMALVRLTAEGQLDFSFDDDGITEVQGSTSSEFIHDLTLQPDGKIVVAGYARVGNYNQIMVARFLSGIMTSSGDRYTPQHNLSLYPNPVTDQFRIEYQLDREENITIQLADLQGRIIQTLLPASSRGEGSHVETMGIHQSLAPGMYVVAIKSASGEQSIICLVE